MNVLGISGSLRMGSLNTAALHAAIELAPKGMKITEADLRGFPVFNQDDEANIPPLVQGFKDQIKRADALLIVSPEYNYSIPGGLKNAIDWASRTPQGIPNVFAKKPMAIMGVSPGLLGTARMQYHLRQCFVFLDGLILNKPEIMIGQAMTKFDKELKLIDEPTRNLMATLLVALEAWTTQLKG